MGCTGTEQEYSWENVIPPWQQELAEPTYGMAKAQLGQPATGYEGPIATGIDPLLTMGAGSLMGMQGQGYQPPEYMSYGQQGYGTPGVAGWNYPMFEQTGTATGAIGDYTPPWKIGEKEPSELWKWDYWPEGPGGHTPPDPYEGPLSDLFKVLGAMGGSGQGPNYPPYTP